MGSPRMIPRAAPGAAVIGGGFIGPVHVEALRRIGVEVVGLLGRRPSGRAGAAERLGIPRVYRDLDELLADERGGRRPRRLAQCAPLRAGPAGAGIGPARHLREAAGDVVEETAALRRWPSRGRSRRPRSTTTSATTRSATRSASGSPRGALGRVLSVTGSYVQDWLLYPDDYNWRVEPDGGTNLRAVADIGTHWMDLAQFVIGLPIRAVIADLATFHPRRLKPVGPAETFSGRRERALGRRPETVEITTDDHAAVLLRFDGGRARGVSRLAGHRRPEEPAHDRDRRRPRAAAFWDSESPNRLWIGSRERPNQLLERDPALLGPAAAAISHYPGGHAEGFPDTFKQLLPRRLRLDRRRPGKPGAAARVSRPSPTATTRSGSARRSPAAPTAAMECCGGELRMIESAGRVELRQSPRSLTISGDRSLS